MLPSGMHTSRACGFAALAGVATFVFVVAALHLVQPGYRPSDQLMSELALGPGGMAMILAFGGMAVAWGSISAALAGFGAAPGMRGLLLVAGLLFLAAGIFPLGETATIHIAAIALAFVCGVVAMYLFPSLAGRAASLAPRSFSWSMAAGVAASVALGHSLLPMGVGQRLAATFLLLWIAVLGWKLAMRREGARPSAA